MKKLIFILMLAALMGCEKESDNGDAIFYVTSGIYQLYIDGSPKEIIRVVPQMPLCDDPDFVTHNLKEGKYQVMAKSLQGYASTTVTIEIIGGQCRAYKLR